MLSGRTVPHSDQTVVAKVSVREKSLVNGPTMLHMSGPEVSGDPEK